MRGTEDGYVCVWLKVGGCVLAGSRRYVDNKQNGQSALTRSQIKRTIRNVGRWSRSLAFFAESVPGQ